MVTVKLNNRAKNSCLAEARRLLSTDNYKKMLEEYELINLMSRLERFVIQTPTLGWLVRIGEVVKEGPSLRKLKFNIGGQVHVFGHHEFSLLTGLSFGTYPADNDNMVGPFQDFLGGVNVQFRQLVESMQEEATRDKNSLNLRKVCVLFILHSMVFILDGEKSVNPRAITMVDDPVVFNSYPWGRLIYETLVTMWTHMFKELAKAKGGKAKNFKILTFPFVLQAWVLECLKKDYVDVLAKRIGDGLPRIVRWETFKEDKTLAKQTIYDAENLPFYQLTPTAKELDTSYYKNMLEWVEKLEKEKLEKELEKKMLSKDKNSSKTAIVDDVAAPIDEDNIPGFLTVAAAFKKLNRKFEAHFKIIEGRLDKLERRVEEIEGSIPDGKKLEAVAITRLRTIFKYELDTFKYNLKKEVRADLKLQLSSDSPPTIYELQDNQLVPMAKENEEDDTICEIEHEHPEGRTQRARKPAPVCLSPWTNPLMLKRYKRRKVDKNDADDKNSVFPRPYDPALDYEYDVTKWAILSSWLSNNRIMSTGIGLVPIVRMLDAISCKDLEFLASPTGWLPREIIDAVLQMTNMQGVEYPDAFPTTRWTCLGTLYNKSVAYGKKHATDQKINQKIVKESTFIGIH